MTDTIIISIVIILSILLAIFLFLYLLYITDRDIKDEYQAKMDNEWDWYNQRRKKSTK